jgi:HD superfamily phosphohydrolase
MPVLSLATTLIVTYLIKPRMEKWSPEHWPTVIVLTGIALFTAIYCIVYALNLALIRYGGMSDLNPRLKKRWRQLFMSSNRAHVAAVDYVDRVVDLQIRMSMPSLVQEVVAELSIEDQAASASLQRTIDQYVNRNELRGVINVLGNHWRAPGNFIVHPPRLVDDPVHGCITLDSGLSTLIAQPIVQRLGRIRQLSFSYTQFPSATHTRLSHVLGVAHNVESALSGVFARGVYYQEGTQEPTEFPKDILDQRDAIIRRAKVLAILHDLGHGPFGHALDNYVGYVNRHQTTANPDKVFSRLYVKEHLSAALTNLGFDPDDLMRVLDPGKRDLLTNFDSLIGDLIDSSMDMDRMDYLIRDAHMTGLSMGFTNADALIQCVRPVKSGDAYLLAYDEGGVEYMEHLLYAREAMYRSCYEHPRKRAAERIFERLIREIAKDKPEIIDELYILTDEEVLCALRLVNLESDTAKRLLEQLVANSDYEVVHQVQAKSPNISDQARVWVKGAAMGKGKQSYVDQPAQWEDAIARSSIGAERDFQVQVIVAPPNAYEQKFDAAVILFKDEKGSYRTKEFFDTASRVKEVLSAMNPARATIKVMCSSAIEEAERQRVKQASVVELGY